MKDPCKQYELTIKILDDAYIDQLCVALMRQGYAPYYNADYDAMYITVMAQDLREVGGK